MALWGGRFSGDSSQMFKQVNDSLPFDQIMAAEDIQGSIAWARAIARAGVLTAEEIEQIENALGELLEQAKQNQLDFSESEEEDIHSFVEAYLTQRLGDLGRKLHTGRSRNDQVATDFRLWMRTHVDVLTTENEPISPVPAKARPIDVFVFVQLYSVTPSVLRVVN